MPQSAQYDAINKLTLTVFGLVRNRKTQKFLTETIFWRTQSFFLPFRSLDETKLSMEPPSSLFEKNLRCNNWLWLRFDMLTSNSIQFKLIPLDLRFSCPQRLGGCLKSCSRYASTRWLRRIRRPQNQSSCIIHGLSTTVLEWVLVSKA